MPYFLILPAFALYVVVGILAVTMCSVVKGLRRFRGEVVSVLGWSSAGFVLGNALYLAATVTLIRVLPNTLPSNDVLRAVGTVGFFFLLPFVVSAVGLLGGIVVGLRRKRVSGKI